MTYLTIIGQGFALLFIVFGSYVVVLNWASAVQSHQIRRFHSAISLIGAVFLGAGLAILPRTRFYALLSVPVDYGTLILLCSLPMLIRQFWETSHYNLLAEYGATTEAATTQISLYRRGKFVIQRERKRAAGEMGWISLSSVEEWSRTDQYLTLTSGKASAHFLVNVEDGTECLQQVSGSLWEDNAELSLMGVELVRRA